MIDIEKYETIIEHLNFNINDRLYKKINNVKHIIETKHEYYKSMSLNKNDIDIYKQFIRKITKIDDKIFKLITTENEKLRNCYNSNSNINACNTNYNYNTTSIFQKYIFKINKL